MELKENDIVNIMGNDGEIKFIGNLDGSNEKMVGIKFSSEVGKNDGSYNGKSYFECGKNQGIFMTMEKLKRVLKHNTNDDLLSQKQNPDEVIKNENINSDQIVQSEDLFFSKEKERKLNIKYKYRYRQTKIELESQKNVYMNKIAQLKVQNKTILRCKDLEIEDLERKNRKYKKEIVKKNIKINKMMKNKEEIKNTLLKIQKIIFRLKHTLNIHAAELRRKKFLRAKKDPIVLERDPNIIVSKDDEERLYVMDLLESILSLKGDEKDKNDYIEEFDIIMEKNDIC